MRRDAAAPGWKSAQAEAYATKSRTECAPRVGVARVQEAQAGVPVLLKPTDDYRCGVAVLARRGATRLRQNIGLAELTADFVMLGLLVARYPPRVFCKCSF